MWLFNRNPKLSPLQRVQIAVQSSRTVEFREVLAKNPELLNYQDENGATPLHWAAEKQDLSVVAALLDLGADRTIKDSSGRIPQDIAFCYGELRMGAYTDIGRKIVQRLGEPPRIA